MSCPVFAPSGAHQKDFPVPGVSHDIMSINYRVPVITQTSETLSEKRENKGSSGKTSTLLFQLAVFAS